MARAHRAMRAYLSRYEKELTALPHTVFLCCGIAHQFENYLERIYPAALLESAEQALYFGGELDPQKQRGLDKILARMMRNSIRDSEDDDAMLPGFLPEHVRMLADALRQK